MKKILILASLFVAASCTYTTQRVNLNFSFDDKKSGLGNNTVLDVAVIDDRMDKEILGKKKIGDEEVNIVSEQNLAALLQKRIAENLVQRGFKQGKGKLVEFHIESLKYKAKRKFFIGKSEADTNFKVIVKNVRNGTTFTKNFNLSVKNKHFIMPLEATDANTINDLIQEVVENILNDESLLKSLIQ
jgi:uncharacterized lipoprotein YajG